MADFLLTNDTGAQYPFVKNWFDHFRVCRHILQASQLQALAVKHKCTIIYGSKSWDQDGFCVEVFNGKDADELHTFLQKWHQVARHRDLIVKGTDAKNKLGEKLKNREKMQKTTIKLIVKTKHTIM